RIEVASTAAHTLVDVEHDAALLGEFVTVDADTLPIDDDVALAEVTEGNGVGACLNVGHVLIDLDGIAEQWMLDAIDQVAGRCPEIAPGGVLDAAQAHCSVAVHHKAGV